MSGRRLPALWRATERPSRKIRAQARELWGEEGVIELSLAFATSQVYPVVKTGMGYGEMCLRVQVDARPVEVAKPPAGWDLAASEV